VEAGEGLINVEAIQHSKHSFKSRLTGLWRSHTKSFVREADRIALRKAQKASRRINR
jgi:hypothetical protein